MVVISEKTALVVLDPIDVLAQRFYDIIHKVVNCASAYETAKNNQLPFIIPVSDLLYLPSRSDCGLALQKQIAKDACRKYGITEKLFFKVYDKISPSILQTIYKGLLLDFNSGFRDLPERFAQAVFEAHMLPACGDEPSLKLFRALNEDNPKRFEWVRGNLISAFTVALRNEADKYRGGIPALQEKFMGAQSSATFLNAVFSKMPNQKAMALANLIEISGYDLEDPEIVRSALFELK